MVLTSSALAGTAPASAYAGASALKPEWTCPGGTFCGWDGYDARGTMIVQQGPECRLHDIGSAGNGDRLISYQNRTGETVGLYNWTGTQWALLARVTDGQRGNLPLSAIRQTDAVQVCD
ncbi:peptidase inhibitor family I36 protein [Actinoplanes missouriensis]|uniref:peptidase inhibitor family I36 protein n=1 Tax=Actinoplanes missouriensis TaxID=1866 RepID=UPI001E60C97F|nr:peptidase inhibitor family I36 protein [Actinoplanes missouriensis]